MTPEQKTATDRLHQAILDTAAAYGYDPEFLITDWVVLTAETRWDEDGDQISAYGRLYHNGHMPDYRALGLIDVHATFLRNTMLGYTSGGGDE